MPVTEVSHSGFRNGTLSGEDNSDKGVVLVVLPKLERFIMSQCTGDLVPDSTLKATPWSLIVTGTLVSLASMSALAPIEATADEVDEIVVTARLRNSAEQLIDERMNDEVVTDLLGADMINRIGDSTVAAALRRISGISLVNDKFVYVRGLGERYSSATLNGAVVPSPDLTRNVLPMDIFPTSIVEALEVQKSYSAEKHASFGGGSVNIRTKSIPDSFTFSIEGGAGFNTETDNTLSYAGGGDDDWGTDDGTRALPGAISAAIAQYIGQIGPQSILGELQKEAGSTATILDARALNQQIGLSLNRNIDITPSSDDPDFSLQGSIGNNFYLTDDFEVGFLASAGYETSWRQTTTFNRDVRFPDTRFERDQETTRSVDMDATLNLGARFTEDHEIATNTMYIRNTDDEASISDFFNENDSFEFIDATDNSTSGFQRHRTTFEERDLIVNQARGEHILGADTRKRLPILPGLVPEEATVTWRYSEARANTSIPNDARVTFDTDVDRELNLLTSRVRNQNTAARFRFTTLEDEVIDYAWQLDWPIYVGDGEIVLSGGSEHMQKVRLYNQIEFGLGPNTVGDLATLQGTPSEVFSEANITDAANDFVMDFAGGGDDSYIAVIVTEAAFGKFDWTINDSWRLSAGARWEDYRQLALEWNPISYSLANPQISTDPDVLDRSSFQLDDIYPSVSLTYMTQFWAEVFQLRFGWSETVVYPDLREINNTSYIDARTGTLTQGNPDVVPSTITNFDVRAEWFFNGGDNLTLTLFAKDIADPIEFFQVGASDTNRSREIINAESGEITGLEIEGLKKLGGILGGFGDPFFIQGTITLQDSELVAGDKASAPTNPVRSIAGASEYVVNAILGFDSMDARHTATVSYNVFGERLFLAGRLSGPDAFEQPFNSVDLTYSWYPTDNITVQAKAKNLLDEEVVIEQRGVQTFVEKPGSSVSVSFEWSL